MTHCSNFTCLQENNYHTEIKVDIPLQQLNFFRNYGEDEG